MRSRRGIVVVISACMSVALWCAPAARAFKYAPFRWERPGDLGYFVERSTASAVPAWLAPYVEQAAQAWNGTPTPIYAYKTARGKQQIYINAYSYPDGLAGWGVCHRWDGRGFCYRGQGQVALNYGCHQASDGTWMCGVLQNEPRFDRYVAMHEFGHTFGLDHSRVAGAVMNTASCRSETHCPSAPTTDDINGINGRYGRQASAPGSTCNLMTGAPGAASVAGQTALTTVTLVDATSGKSQYLGTHPC